MRQIKFRGKSADGKWHYGDLRQFGRQDKDLNGKIGIYPTDDNDWRGCPIVDKSTIGQFTGLLDRNGKEVYEGDVVFWLASDIRGRYRGEQGAIFWDKHTMAWAIERDKPCVDGRPCIISRPFDKKHLEVVGNIHDNPELMYNNCKN